MGVADNDTDDSDADELVVVYPTSVLKAAVSNVGNSHCVTTTPLPSLSKNFVRNSIKRKNDTIIEIDDDDDDDDDYGLFDTSRAIVAQQQQQQQQQQQHLKLTPKTSCGNAPESQSTDDGSLMSKPKSKHHQRPLIDSNLKNDNGKKLPPSLINRVDVCIDLDDDDDEDDEEGDDDLAALRPGTRDRFASNNVTMRDSSMTHNKWATSQLSLSSSSEDETSVVNTIVPAKFNPPTKYEKRSTQQQSDSDTSDSDDDSLDAIRSKLNTKPAAIRSKLNTKPAATNTNMSQDTDDGGDETSRTNPNRTKQGRIGAETAKQVQAQAKRLIQEKRNEERLRVRNEKEAANCAKKDERERQRNDKKRAEETEKVAKKRFREECKQTSGKLANEEIAVLLQKDLFNSYTVVPDLERMGYHVQDHPSALQCNAVQWIRKDALQGGAELAVQHLHSAKSEYQHFPIVTILVDDADAFVKLLVRHSPDDNDDDDDEDDFPALEEWLMGIEYGWRASWKIPSTTGTNATTESQRRARPRIILLLVKISEALDKMWIQYRKAISAKAPSDARNEVLYPPPTAEELHDAITWILIQFQIECVHCKSNDDVAVQLCKVTRILAESPYRKPVTEFSCIKKIKSTLMVDENDEIYDLERAKDCWMRQLQQIPNVSQPRALYFTKFYPTALSLWIAYQNPTLTTQRKKSLVAHCFHDTRAQTKLSEMLYTVMTSQDPNEMIH